MAVLGAGRIGKIHAANVAADQRTRLTVVADPHRPSVEALAEQLGCAASLDCAAAIERDDVDAVLIGTPTDTHIDLMLRAVKLGKPVLCEKPIDLDISRATAAVEEVEKLKGRVMLAFNRRFDPDAMRLRKAIDDGEIGDVRQVVLTSRDPGLAPREYLEHSGGIFRDCSVHDFDIVRWVTGREVVEVYATGGNRGHYRSVSDRRRYSSWPRILSAFARPLRQGASLRLRTESTTKNEPEPKRRIA
jgi:myo-inositol 2-dehydrogenase/D-chiro-inositol 1-dehydrogenase